MPSSWWRCIVRAAGVRLSMCTSGCGGRWCVISGWSRLRGCVGCSSRSSRPSRRRRWGCGRCPRGRAWVHRWGVATGVVSDAVPARPGGGRPTTAAERPGFPGERRPTGPGGAAVGPTCPVRVAVVGGATAGRVAEGGRGGCPSGAPGRGGPACGGRRPSRCTSGGAHGRPGGAARPARRPWAARRPGRAPHSCCERPRVGGRRGGGDGRGCVAGWPGPGRLGGGAGRGFGREPGTWVGGVETGVVWRVSVRDD